MIKIETKNIIYKSYDEIKDRLLNIGLFTSCNSNNEINEFYINSLENKKYSNRKSFWTSKQFITYQEINNLLLEKDKDLFNDIVIFKKLEDYHNFQIPVFCTTLTILNLQLELYLLEQTNKDFIFVFEKRINNLKNKINYILENTNYNIKILAPDIINNIIESNDKSVEFKKNKIKLKIELDRIKNEEKIKKINLKKQNMEKQLNEKISKLQKELEDLKYVK